MRNRLPSTVFVADNGVGNGEQFHEKLSESWWKMLGYNFERHPNDWWDGKDYYRQLDEEVQETHRLLERYDAVARLTSSAGSSHGMNVTDRLVEEGVDPDRLFLFLGHGWLEPPRTEHETTTLRRKLGGIPCTKFEQSLERLKDRTLPNLGRLNKNNILLLTQLTDFAVPKRFRFILDEEGNLDKDIEIHKSKTFGHFGGYVYHQFLDFRLITRFVRSRTVNS